MLAASSTAKTASSHRITLPRFPTFPPKPFFPSHFSIVFKKKKKKHFTSLVRHLRRRGLWGLFSIFNLGLIYLFFHFRTRELATTHNFYDGLWGLFVVMQFGSQVVNLTSQEGVSEEFLSYAPTYFTQGALTKFVFWKHAN